MCREILVKLKIYPAWICFSKFLGKINSIIIMFIIYFVIICPVGFVLKIFRKELLNKKLDKNLDTYFRNPSSEVGSMSNQF